METNFLIINSTISHYVNSLQYSFEVVNVYFSQFKFTWSGIKSNKTQVLPFIAKNRRKKIKTRKKMDPQNTTEMGSSKEERSEPQPPKLKVFEMIQKSLATAGITPGLVDQSYPFNWTISFEFLMFGTCIYLTCVFIIHDVGTFAEYTQAVYSNSLATLIVFALLILLCKAEKLFEFIDDTDNINSTSE